MLVPVVVTVLLGRLPSSSGEVKGVGTYVLTASYPPGDAAGPSRSAVCFGGWLRLRRNDCFSEGRSAEAGLAHRLRRIKNHTTNATRRARATAPICNS